MTRAVGRAFISIVLLTRCSALAAEPPQAGSRMPAFRTPPGFVVEKVAGPPLVRYPLFAAFDDRGRLFVAEGTGTNLPADELLKRSSAGSCCSKTPTATASSTRARVFADGLVFPPACSGTTGPSTPPRTRASGSSKTPTKRARPTRRDRAGHRVQVQRQRLRHPRPVPRARRPALLDRRPARLQGADARRGERSKGSPPGSGAAGPTAASVERLCGGGFDNPVELAFTPEGELIGTMDQGPGDCLLHYVEGGVYPMDHPCLKEFPGPARCSARSGKYTAVLPAALCGLTRYRSDDVRRVSTATRLFSTALHASTRSSAHNLVARRLDLPRRGQGLLPPTAPTST